MRNRTPDDDYAEGIVEELKNVFKSHGINNALFAFRYKESDNTAIHGSHYWLTGAAGHIIQRLKMEDEIFLNQLVRK